MSITRRRFVIHASASLALASLPSLANAQRGVCAPTEPDVEGPYYRVGAPLRADLTTPELEGRRLIVRGLVRGRDCEPLPRALLDVWQADARGHYDNDGSGAHAASEIVLRGRIRADAQGRYELRTIVPGRYRDGVRYRPSHVHVKLVAPGHRILTTQLYFEGDPYNEGDRFFGPSRVLRAEPERGELAAAFDFTLA